MYLMGFVNSTFETRRPIGNLELVDLSLENKYHPPEQLERRKELGNLSNGHLQNGTMTHSNVNANRPLTSTKIEKGNGNGATSIMKPIARPRRTSLEDLPADLHMEPLCPLVLRSPDGVTSVGAQGLRLHNTRERNTTSCLPEENSVYVLEKDASSRRPGLHQEWSFRDLAQREQDTTTTTSKMTPIRKIRLASKLASVFADGGISSRVHHHPLDMTEEDEDRDSRTGDTIAVSFGKSCEKMGGDENVESLLNTDDGFARILQHLERIEGSVKDLKARVDDAKLRIEQSEAQEWGAPITTPPRSSKLGGGNAEPREQAKSSLSPSLSSPVMESMGAVASPELPYSWNKKLPNLPKMAVSSVESEPTVEERELRYSSPPMTESDVNQDVLSFRLWEQDETPQRRSISVSRDFQELDLETDENAKSKDLKLTLANPGRRRFANSCDSLGKDEGGPGDSTENDKVAPKPSPPNFDALLNFRTFDLRSRRATSKVDADVRHCEEESQQEYPSPSSFTCGLSPTSLFSDDQGPFQMSVSSDDNMFSKFQPFPSVHKSPRSVLSPTEPDEISHFTSDSSETREKDRRQAPSCAYLYNDESSDLESPMKAKNGGTVFTHRPFPTFTYSVGKEMGETSSEEDPDEARDDTSTSGDANVADLAELEFFEEANHREPWLVNDGGVLDDSDLEFLLSPDFRIKDTTSVPAREEISPLHTHEQQLQCAASEEVSEIADPKTMYESRRKPKSQNHRVPYVTGELHGNDESPVRSPARGGSRRHERASEVFVASLPRGEEKTPKKPLKRSVNFAPDLVKEIPHSTPNLDRKQPLPVPRANPEVKNDDDNERLSRSAKTWEVEEEGPSIMTSRRRWRKHRDENSTSPGGSTRGSWSFSETRSSGRQRVAQLVPCAGKLFSWPQRFAFKVSKSRPMDSDDESWVGDQSFGMSARRDAEQVRRILRGSHKKYSDLSVADIMKEDFR